MELLGGNARRTWGQKEVKLPSRTHYVKYTQNYMSRADVDFDAGVVTVETVDEKDPRASLRSALVTTLLSPDDPRAVDLFTDGAVELSSARKPYLLGLVVDAGGRPVATPGEAEAFADHLLKGATSGEVELVRRRRGRRRERLQPPAVFQQLRTRLPYEETRQYLVKVTNYRKQFANMAN